MKFMFEPLANGLVERLCRKISSMGIPYGFGGVARIGEGVLPAENIIAEHYRLGSSMVILSRSFCNVSNADNLGEIERIFNSGVVKIRDFETDLGNKSKEYFIINKKIVNQKVAEIVSFKEKSQ